MVWTKKEKGLFDRLNTPNHIQQYLNNMPYDSIDQESNRSPRYVILEQRANCFEGALLAAAIMEYHGHTPWIIDMLAHNDDDHEIMVYRMRGLWGSIAKSNTTTLRGREPVYRTPRELIMSYFDFYFNRIGDKTLRSYTNPINLNMFNDLGWRTTDADLDTALGEELNRLEHFLIMPHGSEQYLHKADPQVLEASLLGSDPHGLYKIKTG